MSETEQPQWLVERMAELRKMQEGKSRQEVAAMLEQESEHVFDPQTAPKQAHRWIDRGLKYSCEGAGHPYHQAFKKHEVGALMQQ